MQKLNTKVCEALVQVEMILMNAVVTNMVITHSAMTLVIEPMEKLMEALLEMSTMWHLHLMMMMMIRSSCLDLVYSQKVGHYDDHWSPSHVTSVIWQMKKVTLVVDSWKVMIMDSVPRMDQQMIESENLDVMIASLVMAPAHPQGMD